MADTKLLPRKATDLLKQDHKMVKRMFRDYEDLEDEPAERKRELFETIKRELLVHSQIEQEIFYPRIARLGDEDSAELVREAEEEHKIVSRLLEELSAMTAVDAAFEAKMTVLCESVEHHIDEEEGEIFKKAKSLPRAEQDELARDLWSRKQALTGEEI